MKIKNNYFIFLIISILVTSCSYEKTTFDIGSLFDPTWDFSKTSELTFDENYVEIKNGKAQLKPLDLNHEGDDFNNGNHVGTYLRGNGLASLNFSQFSEVTDVRLIAPEFSQKLIGYWRLDGDGKDAQGVLDATTSAAPVFLPGRLGQGANFDGSSYLILEENAADMTNYTVSFWVLIGTQSSAVNIFHRGAGGACAYSPIVFFDGASSEIRVRESGCAGSGLFASVVIDRSNWNHITITQSNSNSQNFYLNGVLVGSGNIDSSAIFSNFKTIIGGQIVGSGSLTPIPQFEGSVDEVSIWSEALDSATISKVYLAQSKNFADHTNLSPEWAPKYDNIVGYWKMDGNWQDSSGNGNHGTALSSGPSIGSISKIGSHSGQFTRTSDSGLTISPLSITDEYTVSAWVNINDFGPSNDTVVFLSQRVSGAPPTDTIFQLRTLQDGHARARQAELVMLQGGFFRRASSGTTNLLSLGAWHHIVGRVKVGSSPEMSLFLDGEKVANTDLSGFGGYNTTSLISSIGADGGYLAPDGFIDEATVWNMPLADSEIMAIYHRQKQKYAGHHDSEVIDLGNTTSNWPDLSWLTSLPFGKELVGDFDNDGNPDSESSSDYSSLSGNLSDGLVGYWNFNEKSMNTAPGGYDFFDRSGRNNHGRESGSVTTGFPGQLHYALKFDGVDDQVSVDHSPDFNFSSDVNFTVSSWVKLSDADTQVMMSTTGAGSPHFTVFYHHSASGAPRAFITDGLGGFCSIDGSQAINDDQWHLLTIVFNREGLCTTETIKVYVDGQFDQNSIVQLSSVNTNIDITNLNTFKIGHRGTDHSNGSIDEVIVWNQSLSSQEIQQLYRRGANRIKFQVKSCVDSSCECKSLSTSPVGSASDCDGDTIVNALDFDDIHKAEFIGPGGDGTTYYSELFNRRATDLTFNCGDNNSDSDSNVCVNDEITLGAGPRPTSPVVSYDDLPLAARPDPNPYFQYRVYMEADENTACDGSPCLPELTSVNLNPSGTDRYYGSVQEVKPTKPLAYTRIQSIELNADDCVTYQLSPDGISYFYVSGGSWVPATDTSHRSTKLELENNIVKFSNDHGPGFLHIKAFLATNSNQTSSCSILDIDVVSTNK